MFARGDGRHRLAIMPIAKQRGVDGRIERLLQALPSHTPGLAQRGSFVGHLDQNVVEDDRGEHFPSGGKIIDRIISNANAGPIEGLTVDAGAGNPPLVVASSLILEGEPGSDDGGMIGNVRDPGLNGEAVLAFEEAQFVGFDSFVDSPDELLHGVHEGLSDFGGLDQHLVNV